MVEHSEIPTADLPFAALADWLVAPVRMALLHAALKLGLPEILIHAHSLPRIAASLKQQHGRPADLARLASLMDAMTAAGLVRKKNGAYANGRFAQSYLCTSSPAYLGHMVASLAAMQHRNLSGLSERLFCAEPFSGDKARQTGSALRDEAHWRQALAGLAAYQKAGAADTLARLIAGLPGAAQFRSMLDLGCGPGIIALRTAAVLPGLHVTLCDFPPALNMARAEAAAQGMAGRVRLCPGDFNTCDFGTGYDLVWACQSLYYAKDLCAFLGRVRGALRTGGLFVSVHEGVTDGVTPADLVLSRLSLAMEGQDVSLPRGQMAAAATAAGLEHVQARPVPMLFGEAEMEVFQKPHEAAMEDAI